MLKYTDKLQLLTKTRLCANVEALKLVVAELISKLPDDRELLNKEEGDENKTSQ